MATIDKELLKQIVNAKQPRNYIFVEGSDDSILVVNKSKISGGEQEDAEKRAKNGKVVSRGKVQVEQGEDGKKKVVFYTKQPKNTLVPKLRRALKQHAGLSRVVELRDLKGDDGDGPVNKLDQPNGQLQNVKPEHGPLEGLYVQLRDGLLEEIEALKELKPKAALKIQKQLEEAKKKLGLPNQGDGRFKDCVKLLKKLSEEAAKLRLKATPSKEQQAISDRARYKNLRAAVVGQIHTLKDIAGDLVQEGVNALVNDADPLVADTLPEKKRNYAKALKILEKTKTSLDKRELLAQKNQEELRDTDDNFVQFRGDVREAKLEYAKFVERMPQAKEVGPFRQMIDDAVEQDRNFHHENAVKQLKVFTEQVKPLLRKHESTVKTLENIRTWLLQSHNLEVPRIPKAVYNIAEVYLDSAQTLVGKGQLDEALAGAKKVQDLVREVHSTRKMFLESARVVEQSLHKAFTHLPKKDAEAFEQRYLKAYAGFEVGDFKAAYQEVTTLESELLGALRNLPEKDGPKSRNLNVDDSPQSPEVFQGETESARRLKFKLNLEGCRRGLVIFKDKRGYLNLFEQWIERVVNLETNNFEDAEQLLTELVDQMRSSERLMKSGPKNDDDLPPPRPRERRQSLPQPPKPETTNQWSKRIDLGKISVNEENKLGSGGQGAIYKLDSKDPKTPPLVMKVPRNTAFDYEFDGLRDEAKGYELVGDHPNIVKSLGMQNVGGKQGLVLELVQGSGLDDVAGNLRTRLKKGEITHTQFWSSVQYTLSKTLEVLDHMHSKGLTHNDIKPENVMIDQTTGDVKVIDLGTVRMEGEQLDESTPQYRAPELPQGSTSQTDIFSTGASGFQMAEGEFFHFNQRSGGGGKLMLMHDIATKYGKLIGDVDEDELAVTTPTEKTPLDQTMNEQGQVDPQGTQVKRNEGVTTGKTAYAEFMNWLLHPDPKKRPSAKEALQHPFLRDRVLTDDQVKDMIRQNMVDPPQEQVGKEPLRKVSETAIGHVTHLSHQALLQQAKDVLTFNLGRSDLKGLLELREAMDKSVDRATDSLRIISAGVRALESICKNSVTKNSSSYFKDLADLKTLQKALQEWTSLESVLRRSISRLDKSLVMQGTQNEEPNSEVVNVQSVTTRVRYLKQRRLEIAAKEIEDERSSLPLYSRLQNLQSYFTQTAGLRNRNRIEKLLLVNLMKASKGTNDQQAVGKVAVEFREHLQEVDKLHNKITVSIEDTKSDVEGLKQDLILLETDAQDLLQGLDSAMQDLGQEGLKFQALVKQPRNSKQAMEQFGEARTRFDQSQKILRELQQGARGIATGFIRRAHQLSEQIGPVAPSGCEDLPGRLQQFEAELKRLMSDAK